MVTACVLWVSFGDPNNYHCGEAYRKTMGLNLMERSSGKYQGNLKITKRGPSLVRLMALDSFVLDVADTPANERAFGRPQSGRAAGAFPQVRVLGLCEAGTHVFWKCLIKPHNRGEIPMARHLVRFLEEKMLFVGSQLPQLRSCAERVATESASAGTHQEEHGLQADQASA